MNVRQKDKRDSVAIFESMNPGLQILRKCHEPVSDSEGRGSSLQCQFQEAWRRRLGAHGVCSRSRENSGFQSTWRALDVNGHSGLCTDVRRLFLFDFHCKSRLVATQQESSQHVEPCVGAPIISSAIPSPQQISPSPGPRAGFRRELHHPLQTRPRATNMHP